MEFKQIRSFLNKIDTFVDPRETLVYGLINVFSGVVVLGCVSSGINRDISNLNELVTLLGAATYGASYGQLLSEKY